MGDLWGIHPELAKRYLRLQKWAENNGWQMGITSGARTYSEQKRLYTLYITGQRPILAVNPDIITGRSPWGWYAQGSLHMVQPDAWAHALDIWWIGPTTRMVHEKAYLYGLQYVNSQEIWHTQWWDFRSGIFPVIEPEEEEDMTVDEFRAATGLVPDPDGSGKLGMYLLETLDTTTNEATYKWYDYATALIFIHQELKLKRLGASG